MAWLSGWNYRVKVTVLATKVDADLTDFPVYVDLSDLPAGFHTNIKAGGVDIRVTTSDGETEVPREVVFYDADTDTGELHFKGNIDSDTDTDFYIYYGNSGASDYAVDATYGRNNVWSDYEGVWHLQEAVNTNSDGYVDSTGNGNNGTGVSMAISEPNGKLSGNAQELDGSADYIECGDVLDLSTNDMTIQGWAYCDEADASNSQFIVSKSKASAQSYRYGVRIGANSNYLGLFFQGNGGSDVIINGTTNVIGGWHLGHFVFDRSANGTVYTDGGDAQSGSISSWDSLDFQSTNPFRIGAYTASDNTGIWAPFDGKLDEIRIRFSVLSSTWVSTEYNNQSSPSTFLDIGSQETELAETLKADQLTISFLENSSRDAKVTGKATANSNRSAKISGKATAYNVRTAVISGKEVSNNERDSRIIGKDISNDNRISKIIGLDSSDSARNAKITGSVLTGDLRNAHIFGKDLSGAVRNSKVKGLVSADSNRNAHISGILLGYSMETSDSLRTNFNTLNTVYTETDYENVALDDNVFVDLVLDNTFGTHLFIVENEDKTNVPLNITIGVKSDVSPSESIVYLQIWNKDTLDWQTIDTENTANSSEEFILTARITENLSYYYGDDYVVSVRVYQEII